MSNKQYFHFTIGPVQSFVGQARRTRDFWAGSFLLSWLSGVAMQSTIAQGGVVLFPQADDSFLNAISGKGNTKPQQGSIPNRFKVIVDKNFNPQQVVEDVQTAWQALAEIIYNKEIKEYELESTKIIWDRQVKHFWEISWVLVDDIENSSGLDCRKNWRVHYLPDESGIKCTLMGDWQELSGIEGVRKKDRENREQFWCTIAEKNNAENDFSQKEMLCAMSYVKRRFIQYFADFTVKLSGFTAYGWQLPKAVPSVSYIAAAPWFGKVLQNANYDDIKAFHQTSEKLYGLSEYESHIKCIEDAHRNKRYKGIDGNAFHEIILDNTNKTDGKKAQPVKYALKKLKKDFGDISPFYAVLMMDGDSLGKQMSDRKKQTPLTKGLATFTKRVPELVQNHNGFLIYAGGDDVLALVTLEDALDCALAIRTHYQDCFHNTGIETSISAAVIYTHINSPLKNILHESHQLLDNVAKEKAGRDAIAVRVYKGSGLSSEWAKKWGNALDEHGFIINTIVQEFANKNNQYVQFSSKFFYKIRQRFEFLYGKDKQQKNPISEEDAIKLMAMEYLQSLDDSKMKLETAEAMINPLINQCKNAGKNNNITADTALLIRFLAQKGIEGGRK
ncbi:MAG: type III-B CRISPR-associated protein Cas10/Cmr2 [Gammaproteobacteria bacterium]|nr:type III-B CRISPR-associated protein Cas10/Cmr2 [Gammaproteobacteria bacterium]